MMYSSNIRASARAVLRTVLFALTRAVLRRHAPTVIAVTGSVGKSTTVRAIATILRSQTTVCAPHGNFNTVYGVPLTIAGVHTAPGASVWRWCDVFWRLGTAIVRREFARVVVVELGIDRRGEMAQLVRLARPHIGVVTMVDAVHAQYIGDKDAIAKEKAVLIQSLPPEGVAVLNADDPRVAAMAADAPHVRWVSAEQGDFVYSNARNTRDGVSFDLTCDNKRYPVHLPNICGTQLVPSFALAAAAARAYGLSCDRICSALSAVTMLPHRMQVQHCHGVTIIDDTYNAAPPSMAGALQTLRTLPASRRVVCVGDMRELGDYERRAHRELAQHILHSGATVVVTVGTATEETYRQLRHNGTITELHHCPTAADAAAVLRRIIRDGDTVLIKGSNGVGLSSVVDALCS